MDATALHEALDALDALDALTTQDLSSLTDAEVHELVTGLCRARARVDGALFGALSVWDARMIWSDDGSKGAGARIAAESGWKKAAADQAMARARKLRRMPATGQAIAAGRLTADYVELLHEAAEVELDDPFTDYEPVLVDACAAVGWAESRDQIHRWIEKHDPDGADERAAKRHAKRQLSAGETLDGQVHLQGLLPRMGGQEFLAELNRLERQLYLDDQSTGNVRTASQRRADAAVEMARRSAALDGAEVDAGRAPRVTLSVVLGLNAVEHLCELLSGTVITPGEIVPLFDRCDIERIVFDGPDHDVTKVSSQRSFTGALRRAIVVRDRRCTHPSGCDTPADRCDIDHIIERFLGGETSRVNGRAMCATHNQDRVLRERGPSGWRILRVPYGAIPDTGTTPRSRRTCPNASDGDDPDDDARSRTVSS
ncbi:MAG: DUF222 domain-containing protein [Ilumatobacteraceae bacterium]